jgi:hypothetical protein
MEEWYFDWYRQILVRQIHFFRIRQVDRNRFGNMSDLPVDLDNMRQCFHQSQVFEARRRNTLARLQFRLLVSGRRM